VVVTTLVVVLGLLGLVLKLRAQHSACYGTDQAVSTADLATTKVAGSTTAEGTHQAPVTLGLSVGICRTIVLLARLTIGVGGLLALWVLVMRICALLRELVLGLSTRVLSLLAVLTLVLLIVWSYLTMLETAMGGGTVLLVVALLIAAVIALI